MDETEMLYYFALIKRYCNSHRECYKCAFYIPYDCGGGGCAFTTNALGNKPNWWKLNRLESCAHQMCREMREEKIKEAQGIKRGKWIHISSYRDCEGDLYSKYKCSCCGFALGGVYDRNDLTNFCGGCGASMREEE